MKNSIFVSILVIQTALLLLPQGSVAAGPVAGGGRAIGGAQASTAVTRGVMPGFVPGHSMNRGNFGRLHRNRLFFPYYGYSYVPYASDEPSLSDEFGDTRKMLDESKSKQKLGNGEYAHLSRRLNDLKGKARSLDNAGGGAMDQGSEEDIRRDLRQLQGEAERSLSESKNNRVY